jgi:hypothetical protein
LFRHVTDIDHHYSDVIGLRAGAPVLGPPKHLIKQSLSKLFSRKNLVGRKELAQLGLSKRLTRAFTLKDFSGLQVSRARVRPLCHFMMLMRSSSSSMAKG